MKKRKIILPQKFNFVDEYSLRCSVISEESNSILKRYIEDKEG